MEYRRLGRTGLQVSVVGLGTGGPSRMGQASGMAFEEQYRLIHGALDLGINLFDTAALYGDSEELLGRALADVAHDRYFVTSKCSPFANDEARSIISPEELRSACERSLSRLGVDYLDVYQLHAVRPAQYKAVVEALYPTLEALRDAGKIRFAGITEVYTSDPGHDMLATAVRHGIWDTVMVKYGILNQTAEQTLLPLCEEHDVGVLDMAAVRIKLSRPEELRKLIADWVAEGVLEEGALPLDAPLGWLVDDETDSMISAGYKFAVAHPAISTLLTGTANLDHLKANVDAVLGAPLPDESMQRLRAVFGPITAGV